MAKTDPSSPDILDESPEHISRSRLLVAEIVEDLVRRTEASPRALDDVAKAAPLPVHGGCAKSGADGVACDVSREVQEMAVAFYRRRVEAALENVTHERV